MTSVSKPRIPYGNQPAKVKETNFGAKQICLIVGLVCLAGFFIDALAIGMPLNLFDLPWRVNFLQQIGDRSIVLLFGVALFLYSQLGNRRLTKPLSLLCLGVGVAFMLSCILVVRDSLILKDQSLNAISTQLEQLQSQIETTRNSSEIPPEVTLEQFDIAAQQLTGQAEQLRQNTSNQITKSGIASIGNLIVVGAGLIGLGRFGLTASK